MVEKMLPDGRSRVEASSMEIEEKNVRKTNN